MSEIKNKTAKGLAWGGIISLLQQVLGLVFSITIARILSPSDYGMVGLLSIFTAMATVLQESGFVFVLTNRPSISKSEYSSVFWFNVSMSFAVYLILYASAPLLASYYGKEELVSLSRYVFLGFFISSFGIIQSAYLYRQMKVKEKGVAIIISILFSGIIGIILAKQGYAYWGLASQGLFSSLISTIILWLYSPFRPLLTLDSKFLKQLLPDGIKFALPNFVSVISANIYSVILGKLYTVVDVGFYSQGNKLNTYGYSTTLGMLRNVSQPMLIQVRNDREATLHAFRKLVRFTAFVSFPTMFSLALVAPELIEIVLTPKWLPSAYLLRILCAGGAFTALSTLFTYYIVSQNKSSLYMWLGVGHSLVSIVMAVIASFGGVVSLAYACSAFNVLGVVVYYLTTKKMLGYSLKMLASDIFPILSVAFAIIIGTYLLTSGIENIYYLILAKITIVCILFVFTMQLMHFDIYMEIKEIVKTKLIHKS